MAGCSGIRSKMHVLHLTVAADLAVSMIATADGVMADAALSMGLQVERF